MENRLDILHSLGLKFNGEEYFLKTDDYYLNMHHTEIFYDSDERFNKIIDSFKEIIRKYEKV
jgi:UDP-N-acetylglucosamine 2-epimerase